MDLCYSFMHNTSIEYDWSCQIPHYNITIVIFAGMSAEDEWYNKSLSALRMNSGHHANLAAAPMLQYQT